MAIRVHAALAILAVLMQIALGGWVSSNYAALACIDFPTCLGAWVPETDFTQAFRINRESGLTAGDDSLSPIALITIHWSHRMGALVVALIAGSLSFALLRLRDWRNWGLLLGAILLAQIGLGIANVLFHLPLAFAVAHNAGAAFLLTASLALNVRLWQATQHMV